MTPLSRPLVATCVALFLAAIAHAPRALAQPGALDTSFGTNGTARIGFGDGQDQSRTLALLADGRFLVAGKAEGCLAVARYQSNGAADPSFGEQGVFRLWSHPYSDGWAVDVQADGRIIVVGYSSLVGPIVTRLLVNGTLDPMFGVGGFADLSTVPGLAITAIKVLGGDAILLAGSIDGSTASSGRFAVCRLTASGALDPSFDGDGVQSTTMPNGGSAAAMTLQSDGKIVLAGSAKNVGGGSSLALVRYTSNGALDTSFDGDGRVITAIGTSTGYASASAILTQVVSGSPDKLLVAGSAGAATTPSDGMLARYNLNGTLDTSFGSGGIVLQAVSSGSDGYSAVRFVPAIDRVSPARIFVAGYTAFPAGQLNSLLCSYAINGTLNTSFSGDGMVVEQIGSTRSLLSSLTFSGERLIVSGEASQGTEQGNFMVARFLSSTGAFDPTFDADGMLLDDVGDSQADARAAVRQADGRIVVAGSSRGGYLQVVTRLLANGALDSTFSGDGRASIVTGGTLSYLNDVLVQPDQKLVVAGTVSLNNAYRVTVARLLPNGSLDPTFGGAGLVFLPIRNPEEHTPFLALQSDGRLLLASDASGHASDSVRVTRLLANGAVDVSFGVGGSVMILDCNFSVRSFAFALQPDDKSLVVTQQKREVGQSIVTEVVVTRLTTSGALDPTFGVGGVARLFAEAEADLPSAILVQSDGRIVVTGVRMVSTINRDPWVFRLTADGQPDPSYGVQGYFRISGRVVDESIVAATLQPFDRLLVAGRTGPENAEDQFLARLSNVGSLDLTFSGDGFAAFDLAPWAEDIAYDVLPDVAGSPILLVGESRGLMSVTAVQPGSALAGVDEGPEAAARTPLALAAPWPNPARGAVTLSLRLGAASSVSAQVLDVQGRHVRTLAAREPFAAGAARLHWDGRDASGRAAAAGLYFVRVEAEGHVATRRIVVAR